MKLKYIYLIKKIRALFLDFIASLFEAFDENWKDGMNPEGYENHFGLFNLQNQAKFALWDAIDKGFLKGLTRNGKPITKSYNGNEKALWQDVKVPRLIKKQN